MEAPPILRFRESRPRRLAARSMLVMALAWPPASGSCLSLANSHGPAHSESSRWRASREKETHPVWVSGPGLNLLASALIAPKPNETARDSGQDEQARRRWRDLRGVPGRLCDVPRFQPVTRRGDFGPCPRRAEAVPVTGRWPARGLFLDVPGAALSPRPTLVAAKLPSEVVTSPESSAKAVRRSGRRDGESPQEGPSSTPSRVER